MAIFAQYAGIDGESKDANHEKWIDIVAFDWGAHVKSSARSGAGRRRAAATIEDLFLSMDYEKAAPKLQEKCLKGAVIAKLIVEFTATFGGARSTYLRYELKNVSITSWQTETADDPESPPRVYLANRGEEIKVTYTEYDETGVSLGNVETVHKVKRKAKK